MNVFDLLLERGFIGKDEAGNPKQVTDLAIREILGNEQVTCYIGFDPSASSLHVGHLLPIMALAHMQRAGHRPIAVVGGGTGLIGDPTGKTEMRQFLTPAEINTNLQGVQAQLKRYLDFGEGQARLVNNADWLLPLNYVEFLRDIGPHFSVNRMLTADSVKLRLEKGLSFIEFNYMVFQAYDFFHLFRTYGCRLQMGGDDQWGNICAGIELIRRISQTEAYGFTFPLLMTATGEKMGKTVGGAIWLDAQRLPPYLFFQYWRNLDDRDVERFLALFTFLPMEEVRRLGRATGAEINAAKETLAFEVTKLAHGEEAAQQALETARQLFAQGQAGAEQTPGICVSKERLEQGIWIVELFQEAGLAKSRNQIRQLISEGGAYINRERIATIERQVTTRDLVDGVMLLRAGKKRYAQVRLTRA